MRWRMDGTTAKGVPWTMQGIIPVRRIGIFTDESRPIRSREWRWRLERLEWRCPALAVGRLGFALEQRRGKDVAGEVELEAGEEVRRRWRVEGDPAFVRPAFTPALPPDTNTQEDRRTSIVFGTGGLTLARGVILPDADMIWSWLELSLAMADALDT